MSITESHITAMDFNPRSLAGATEMYRVGYANRAISIHAPSRERQKLSKTSNGIKEISIHAPSRERLPAFKILLFAIIFQSTLPRGSDILFFDVVCYNRISIHAPSRERPMFCSAYAGCFCISIHAPSRERPKSK